MMMTKPTEWVCLGDYIEQCIEVNSELQFGFDDAMGMTITKEIIPTKADLKGADLSKFLVVKPKDFVYNPRTHGKKIGLGFNNSTRSYIISWNNVAFRVKDPSVLLPDYLYMIVSREEWDRNACFRSWGSSTEVFSWTEFCLMEIPLPSIEVQRELVAVYNGLKLLAEQNEALLPRLSAACHAYIVDCRTKYPSVPLGDYIKQRTEKNSDNKRNVVMGLSTLKTFREPSSKVNKNELGGYKLIDRNQFAYVPTTDTWKVFACAVADSDFVVSPIYCVFRIIDESIILPKFLYLLFCSKEFDRFARFNSWGSARENFSFSELQRVQIPLPPIEVQRAIVDVYECAERAKRIAAEARTRLKDICPALIQRAAHGSNSAV